MHKEQAGPQLRFPIRFEWLPVLMSCRVRLLLAKPISYSTIMKVVENCRLRRQQQMSVSACVIVNNSLNNCNQLLDLCVNLDTINVQSAVCSCHGSCNGEGVTIIGKLNKSNIVKSTSQPRQHLWKEKRI